MTKKRKKFQFNNLGGVLPYIIAGVVTLVLVFVGSIDKRNNAVNLSLDSFAENDYKVSVDQLSELYLVADLSDALSLASAQDVASNYVITNTMYNAGISLAGKPEKPNLTGITASRGVIEYTVAEGESMESIAAKFGISTDQIRWSNGLKNTSISAGSVLYLPSKPGIVYTVKSSDSIESIAEKYGSNAEEIIALNDLELSGISEGNRILIKDGSLPEKERPEYVPPVVRPVYTYTYTYMGSTSERQNIEVVGYYYNLGGPYGRGQCTQWAWYNRQDLPSSLGNANTWAARAAAIGYVVDHNPAPGAVFQSSAGWYGHVGYVESVNPDGSIVATEMNYGIPYRVIRSTIPASSAAYLNYIH
ncbi:LysM peptidoglycan-binding domain-containing protein [Candidatus Saccharibacteria bacterium]|nr:LysM peptidoglycan-binding domain-containing protein [Candidatus Saccharibacteria bacterium]